MTVIYVVNIIRLNYVCDIPCIYLRDKKPSLTMNKIFIYSPRYAGNLPFPWGTEEQFKTYAKWKGWFQTIYAAWENGNHSKQLETIYVAWKVDQIIKCNTRGSEVIHNSIRWMIRSKMIQSDIMCSIRERQLLHFKPYYLTREDRGPFKTWRTRMRDAIPSNICIIR